jgi:hypothetical protein
LLALSRQTDARKNNRALRAQTGMDSLHMNDVFTAVACTLVWLAATAAVGLVGAEALRWAS